MPLSPQILDAIARLGATDGVLEEPRLDGVASELRWLLALRWPEGVTWRTSDGSWEGIAFVTESPPSADAPFFVTYREVWKLAETDTGFELWLALDGEGDDPVVTWRDVSEDTTDFTAWETQGRWSPLSELLSDLEREPPELSSGRRRR